MNKRNSGYILQIVLCVFMVMITLLLSYSHFLSSMARIQQEVKLMDQERLVEIYFARYLKKEKDTSVLLSDHFSYAQGDIQYTVFDMGSYDEIQTTMRIGNVSYHITVHLTHDDLRFLTFRYDT